MPGAAKVLMMNSGVISDTGQFAVYLAGARRGKVGTGPTRPEAAGVRRRHEEAGAGVRLGELDEEFVYETKEGDRIILGSQTWRVVRIDSDRVLVEAAAPGSSRMPFWRGSRRRGVSCWGRRWRRFMGRWSGGYHKKWTTACANG